MNDFCAGQVKNYRGQVEFAFRLPAGQVEFSGLFLTLWSTLYTGVLKFWSIYTYYFEVTIPSRPVPILTSGTRGDKTVMHVCCDFKGYFLRSFFAFPSAW